MNIEIAIKNAIKHHVEIDFIQKDMAVLDVWNKPVDLIISNPPYIDPRDKSEILPNVLLYEPHLALFAPKEEPLYFYKKMNIQNPHWFTNGNVMLDCISSQKYFNLGFTFLNLNKIKFCNKSCFLKILHK